MFIHNSDSAPKWILACIAMGGIIWRMFKVSSSVDEHSVKIVSHDTDLLKLKLAFPELLTETPPALMTTDQHGQNCGLLESRVCKKMDEVRDQVRDGQTKLAKRMDKMDQLREDSRKDQAMRDLERTKREKEIERLLGRVEEHLNKTG